MQLIWSITVAALAIIGKCLFLGVLIASAATMILGLPGSFVVVGLVLIYALVFNGALSLWWVLVFTALAVVGELLEYVAGIFGAKKLGASNKAVIMSLIGGLVGAVIGSLFAPLLGSVLGALIGAFVGAVAWEYHDHQDLKVSLKSGLGTLVGRILSLVAKLGITAYIIVQTGILIFFGDSGS